MSRGLTSSWSAADPGRTPRWADPALRQWLRAADEHSAWTTSVCTGSLLLASAGLLTGRRATTHWLAMDTLAELGAVPVTERVVTDGKYMTAAGISAGLDMALVLAGILAGDAVAQAIQLALEYDPQPPYKAGSPDSAPQVVADALRARRDSILKERDDEMTSHPVTARTVAVAGVTIRFRESGSPGGPAALLLHGGAAARPPGIASRRHSRQPAIMSSRLTCTGTAAARGRAGRITRRVDPAQPGCGGQVLHWARPGPAR